MACDAELCELWNGDTCVCAAIDGDPDATDDLNRWVEDIAAEGLA